LGRSSRVKFDAEHFRTRFNRIRHALQLYHEMINLSNPNAEKFTTNFLDKGDLRWGHLYKVVDNADKQAFAAGEVSHVRKRAAVITPDAVKEAAPLMTTDTPTGLQNQAIVFIGSLTQGRNSELHSLNPGHLTLCTDPDTKTEYYKIDPRACKNWQGGIGESRRDAPIKMITKNIAYTTTGDVYTDAKYCPVTCVKLYLSKLPTDAPAFFCKPNDRWQATGKWYCAQPMSKDTIRKRVASVFPGCTSHSLKRTGATGVANAGFEDNFAQALGGWKSASSMAPYREYGIEKRQKATAVMLSAFTATAPPSLAATGPPSTTVGSMSGVQESAANTTDRGAARARTACSSCCIYRSCAPTSTLPPPTATCWPAHRQRACCTAAVCFGADVLHAQPARRPSPRHWSTACLHLACRHQQPPTLHPTRHLAATIPPSTGLQLACRHLAQPTARSV